MSIERGEVRRLNPPKVFQAFRRQWKPYRADDSNLFDPKGGEINQEFVRFVDGQA